MIHKNILIPMAVIAVAFKTEDASISLQEAINKNIVTVNVTNLGAYNGESCILEITNKAVKPLKIDIEPGRRLLASESKYQDLLIVKGESIHLKPGDKKSTRINAYCCESNDAGPRQNLSYKINRLADSNMVKLAGFVNTNIRHLSKNSIQQAVWAISNNHASAAISVSNEKEMSLKYFVSKLKNEPIPWYLIKQHIYLLPNGRIHLVNDSLEGKLAYTNSGWTYSKLNLYDIKDNGVLISIGQWLKPGINESYEVALDIKKLKPGKYKICLEDEKQIFTQKDVEI
jgi:hypothetical protein